MSEGNAPVGLHGQDSSSGSTAPYVPSPTPGAPSRNAIHRAHVQSAQAHSSKQADADLAQSLNELDIMIDEPKDRKAMKFPTTTPQVAVPPSNVHTPFNTLRALAGVANIEDLRPMLMERLRLVIQELATEPLSPHQRRLYEGYRNGIEKLLSKPNLEVGVTDYLSTHEDSIKTHEMYRAKATQEVKELGDKLLVAKKLEVWARYGDYLADRWTLLRLHMNTLKGENDASILEYCTSVQKQLEVEVKEVEVNDCKSQQDVAGVTGKSFTEMLWDKPWHKKVTFAASQLGFGMDEAAFAIKQYAARNDAMHAGLKDATSQYDWKALVARVEADLKLLPSLFDPSQREEADAFEKVITEYRDKWVEWVVDADDNGSWVPRSPIYRAQRGGVSFDKISKEIASLPPGTSDAKIDKKLAQLIKEAQLSKNQQAKSVLNKAQTQQLKTDKVKAVEKAEQLEQDVEQLKQENEQLRDRLQTALEAKENVDNEIMILKAAQVDMEKRISKFQERLAEQDGMLTMYRQQFGFGNV